MHLGWEGTVCLHSCLVSKAVILLFRAPVGVFSKRIKCQLNKIGIVSTLVANTMLSPKLLVAGYKLSRSREGRILAPPSIPPFF